MISASSQSITPLEVKAWQDQGKSFLLLDVREPSEVNYVTLPGAVHIPMQEIPSRLGELEAYRDREIVVLCHIGGRSYQVTQYLLMKEYPHVKNLEGGIDAWAEEVDPTLPRY